MIFETMLRPNTLYAVTLDAAPLALVKANDETDAVDLAFGLLAADWYSLEAANDNAVTHPLLAAASMQPPHKQNCPEAKSLFEKLQAP